MSEIKNLPLSPTAEKLLETQRMLPAQRFGVLAELLPFFPKGTPEYTEIQTQLAHLSSLRLVGSAKDLTAAIPEVYEHQLAKADNPAGIKESVAIRTIQNQVLASIPNDHGQIGLLFDFDPDSRQSNFVVLDTTGQNVLARGGTIRYKLDREITPEQIEQMSAVDKTMFAINERAFYLYNASIEMARADSGFTINSPAAWGNIKRFLEDRYLAFVPLSQVEDLIFEVDKRLRKPLENTLISFWGKAVGYWNETQFSARTKDPARVGFIRKRAVDSVKQRILSQYPEGEVDVALVYRDRNHFAHFVRPASA